MKKVVFISLLLSQLLLAREYSDEEIANYIPELKGIERDVSLSVEVAGTRYNLDIQGSEFFNRSINYDIIEGTIGLSYNHENWLFSTFYKGVIDEYKTNSFVVLTGKSDDAIIDRDEWIVSTRYRQSLTSSRNNTSSLTYSLMYFNSNLDAENNYVISDALTKKYNYKTEGVNLSVTYNFAPNRKGSLFFTRAGLLYTQADLDFKEYKNNIRESRYVKDSVGMLGFSLATGYMYQFPNNRWKGSVLVDYNRIDFGDITISDENLGELSTNTFLEQTLALRLGLTYSF